jgi:nicotinamidase-related amidase
MGAFVTALKASLGTRPEIIACGVATDVCVAQGIDGFLERDYPVTVVRDAIYSLGGDDDAWIARWTARGARITTVGELCGPADYPATLSLEARGAAPTR